MLAVLLSRMVSGAMTVVSWWFVVALAAAAFLAWTAFGRGRVRRSYRGQARWQIPRVIVAATLTVLAVANGVNAYFAYLPRMSDVVEAATDQAGRPSYDSIVASAATTPRHRHGVVVQLTVPDRGSGFGSSTALVYLPPQYFTEPSTRFPVLYLFHGSPGVPADWFQGGAAATTAHRAAAAGRPVIVVAPRMSRGWLDDPECVDGIHEHVESHFVQDVVPTVDTTLRTLPDRADRILGGMSAGGYCALDLGLRHRDLAATIIDMSGLTVPTHTGGLRALFGDDPTVVATDSAATSPRSYAPTLAPGAPLRIWFDVGLGDRETRGPIEAIVPVLRARGIDVELHERPGAHTFHVWAPALRAAVPWALGTAGSGGSGGSAGSGGSGGSAGDARQALGQPLTGADPVASAGSQP